MGVVYRAEDPTIGRTVAIKTIHLGELTDSSEREFMRERLIREARSAGILSHPGIVTIYDISEDGDTAYVFMEYVNGETLEKLAAESGSIDKDRIFDILRQTAAALDYAHGKGIVHRDIKPANIMISVDGEAKITDFGVAKILSQQMTQTRSVLGTPYYMSPEQIQGGKIDGRSDQFALAVISYELMTGERPYSAESLPTLLFKIVKEMPASPDRLNPSLAHEVGQVFERTFSKKAADRYPNCSAFVNALALAVSRKPDWLPLARGDSGNLETASPESEAPAPAVAPTAPPPEAEQRIGATQVSRRPPSLPPMPKVRDREGHEVADESHLPRNVMIVVFLIAIVVGGAYTYLEYYQQSIPILGEEAGPPPETAGPGENPPPLEVPAPPSESQVPSGASTAAATGSQASAPGSGEPAPERAETPRPTSPPTREEQPAPTPEVEQAPPPKPKPTPPPSPRHYWVQIHSRPPGARVAADDDAELICKTPCELPLTPGRHVLKFSMAGRRMAPRIIRVPDLTDVTAVLDRLAGTLAIRSAPAGAAIFINGEKRPEVTPALIKLPAGIYRIKLALSGRPDFNDTVEVKDQVITSVGIEW